jgi:PAS domain S-box-containing protein
VNQKLEKKSSTVTWRLSLRLTLSFAILIGAMIGVAWLATVQSYRTERQFEDLSNENHDEQLARQILNYSNINARILMETFTTNDSNQLNVFLKRRDENSKIIDEMINEMSLSREAQGESDLVALIQKRREVYRTNYLAALNVLREGQPEQARTLMVATVLPELTQYHDAVNQYISFQRRRIDEIQAGHSAATAQARRQTLLLISILVLTAGGIAIFVAINTGRHIARRRLAEEAFQAAHRELEDRIAERTAELRAANQQLQQEIGTRRSIEEELRASEARYRQIVQTAEDMIYRLTPTGHLTFVNTAAAKMVGRPAEECVGMHFLTFTRHDFRARAFSFYREQIERKIPTTYLELPLLTDEHNELWVGQNVQLIIENDQVVSVQAVSRDVTQRKLVETQLLESEQRYRTLFESNPEPMWVYDEETLQFIAVNDAAVIQYGYSREEFLTMTIKEIRPDEDLSALANRRAHVVDGYGSYDDFRTWRHRRKDGTIIEVEITWHTLEFLGRPAKLVLAKDVTERTRAQRELQYQKIRFQQLLENAPIGILQVDLQDRILDANEAFRQMFQYSLDEIKGRNINQTIAPADLLAESEAISAATLSGERVSAEGLRRRQDGTLFPVQIFGTPIVVDDQPVGTFAIYVDLSERKFAEDALRASEQRHRDLFTFAPIGIYQSAPDGSIVTANRTMARILGYESVEELMKLNMGRDIYADPNERQRLIEAYDPRGCSSELELRWKKKDGTQIWIELTAHTVKRNGSVTHHYEGYVRDITERKRMEDERQVIAEIIQGVIRTADLSELLSLVHESISKTLYAENCFVALYDEETQMMRFPFWVDKLDPCPDPRPVGVGFSGYVLRTGKPMLVSPELTEEMSRRGEVEKSGSSSKSWLGVPLRTPMRTIGVLVVQHYQEENVYDDHDLEFLCSVGSQVALAIERKRAEEAIQESEERYHRLVELSPDAIVIHQDEKFAFVNSAAISLTGARDERELLGKSIFDVVTPEYSDMLRRRVATMYEGQSSPVVEIKGRRLDGVEVDCELASVPFVYRDRFAVLAVLRDIRDRKRAELALQEANQRALTDYERLVERIAALGQTLANERDLNSILRALREFTVLSVPCDGLVISLYDREKETRRAVYCWVDEHEVEPSDVKDVPVGDGMVGRAIKTSTVIIDNDFQRSMSSKRVIAVGDCEGDNRPQSALTAPMTVLGQTIGCVEVQSTEPVAYRQEHATAMRMAASLAASAIENVTLAEREQQKEEQLRQAQKMEAVGRLAGGVAHDFNNLLTAINGYSDLILCGMEVESPIKSRIQEIKKAGERAASLTRQLLAFSRKQMLQPRVLDLNTIITELDKMLRRLIGEDVLLETRLDARLGKVKADPGQIEQILMNLVVNARDALPVGGHVTIGTRNRHLDQTYIRGQEIVKPGRYVVLSVSDDGCGMNPDTQEKIFEPFFTTKEFGKGTGLGLSTVYGIVKQSEGSIWVYSELGKGTTFNIYLPRVDETAEIEEIPAQNQPVVAGRETILLVEDEQMVRDLSREVLEHYGYTVICAANGEEGLSICREFAGQIDLIITDVVMPRMSGRELAESAAFVRPDARILYMSGFTDDAIVRHGLLDEDFPFIQKPFSPELLASKTRELLDAKS